MNNRAANPGSTEGGFATVRKAQDGDTLVFDKVAGQHLMPNNVVLACGPAITVKTS